MTRLWYTSLLGECIKEEKQVYRLGVVSMERSACWGNNLSLCPAKYRMRKEPWNALVYPSDCTGSFAGALCASVDIRRERLCTFVRARMFVWASPFEVARTMKQNKRLDRKKRKGCFPESCALALKVTSVIFFLSRKIPRVVDRPVLFTLDC